MTLWAVSNAYFLYRNRQGLKYSKLAKPDFQQLGGKIGFDHERFIELRKRESIVAANSQQYHRPVQEQGSTVWQEDQSSFPTKRGSGSRVMLFLGFCWNS